MPGSVASGTPCIYMLHIRSILNEGFSLGIGWRNDSEKKTSTSVSARLLQNKINAKKGMTLMAFMKGTDQLCVPKVWDTKNCYQNLM
jgi:hypothetical protein